MHTDDPAAVQLGSKLRGYLGNRTHFHADHHSHRALCKKKPGGASLYDGIN